MSISSTTDNGHLQRFPIVYGLTWSLFVAAAGTLILVIWAHFSDLSNSTLLNMVYVLHCSAVLYGSISGSRIARERGWYYGGIIGLTYALLMVLISLMIYNTFALDAAGVFRILLMTLIGAFGGIIGINFQAASKHE